MSGATGQVLAEADLANCDLVFSATPGGVAMTHARSLMDRSVKLIDLSADFRIRDVAVWERWYGLRHACPDLIDKAVYGLPEIHRTCRHRTGALSAQYQAHPAQAELRAGTVTCPYDDGSWAGTGTCHSVNELLNTYRNDGWGAGMTGCRGRPPCVPTPRAARRF